jgi:hypothetical protein
MDRRPIVGESYSLCEVKRYTISIRLLLQYNLIRVRNTKEGSVKGYLKHRWQVKTALHNGIVGRGCPCVYLTHPVRLI